MAQEAYLAALSQPRHEHRVDDRLLGLVESDSMQEGGQLPAGQLDELRAERAASRRPLAFALVSRAVRLPPCLLPNDPRCEAACPDSATFGRSGGLSGCHPFCSWGAVSWVCGAPGSATHSTVLRCAMGLSSCCSFGPGGQPAAGFLLWIWSEPPLAPPPWPPMDCIERSPPSPPWMRRCPARPHPHTQPRLHVCSISASAAQHALFHRSSAE